MGINNLTPADAIAAQSARDERMRAEGLRGALEALSGITGWTGLPHRSNIDYGPNTILKARAAIAALQEHSDA